MKLIDLLEALKFGSHEDEPDEGIEVKPSPLHGKGVFATRDFKKGEIIGSLRSKRVSNKLARKIKTLNIKPDVYYLHYYDVIDSWLLAVNDFKYMNSSDRDNNVIFSRKLGDIYNKVRTSGKNTSVIGYPLEAIRDIKKGEEILTHYENYEHFD